MSGCGEVWVDGCLISIGRARRNLYGERCTLSFRDRSIREETERLAAFAFRVSFGDSPHGLCGADEWAFFSFITPLVTIALTTFLFSKITSTGSLIVRGTASFLTLLVIQTIDYSVLVLMGYRVPDLFFTMLLTPGRERSVFLLIDKLCDVVFYLLLRNYLGKMGKMGRMTIKLQAILFLFSVVAYAFMQYLFFAILTLSLVAMQFAVVLCWCFLLCFAAVVLALFFSWSKAEQNKQSQALLQSTNALMVKNYQELHADKVEYAKRLHDFNHHLAAIRSLCRNGKEEEIGGYVDSLLSTTYKEIALCHSGNDIVDAIINCKAAEAHDAHISFYWQADFSVPVPIDPVDLCAILANQIDNAFDACKLIEDESKRKVEVHIWQKTDNMAFFQVINPVAANPFDENGELPSSKKDGVQPHGLGLQNIRETAEKYSGTLRNTYQNGQFISTVFLCYGE